MPEFEFAAPHPNGSGNRACRGDFRRIPHVDHRERIAAKDALVEFAGRNPGHLQEPHDAAPFDVLAPDVSSERGYRHYHNGRAVPAHLVEDRLRLMAEEEADAGEDGAPQQRP